MNLPETLKIGHKTFTVQELSDEEAQALNQRGFIDHFNQHIGIMTESKHPEAVAETIIHEILHGAFYQNRLDMHLKKNKRGDTEEMVVSILAGYLSQIFVDNPDLVEYLFTNAEN